jgi:WXG100 family type VII secretion target
MSNTIKMNYPLMEEMAKTFRQGSQQLQETLKEMKSLSQMMSDGALLGRGGVAFTEAIQGKLCPAIVRLDKKFLELEKDIKDAMADMKEADKTSKSQFQ